MANIFEKKDRHVLPTWRSFHNTSQLGELNGSRSIQLDSTFKPDIGDLLDDWAEHKTIGFAGDILGAALVGNHHDNQMVREVANFVIENPHLSSKAILSAAFSILTPRTDTVSLELDIHTLNADEIQDDIKAVFLKISTVKKALINNPRNAIFWVELGRLYSILGQDSRALRAMNNALQLSSENRFVLRSAARFFVHLGDVARAHDIIRKAEMTKVDPWLLATEISIATMRDRGSVFAKSGMKLLDQHGFHPFNTSELASALASLELKNDKIKSCKKLFASSLINPNDNSLAQAEWASHVEKGLVPIDPKNFNLGHSHEARARDFSERREWQKSIDSCKKWFRDQPFSKGAVLYGNEIASSRMKDHNQAVEIAKLGLLSHPNDAHLLNNIVYSLCMQNKTAEAKSYLNQVRKEDIVGLDLNGVCLMATRGLYFFRCGQSETGRALYKEAIELSLQLDLEYAHTLASINYVREELLRGEVDVSEVIPRLERVAKYHEEEEMREEAEEVLEMYRGKNPQLLQF